MAPGYASCLVNCIASLKYFIDKILSRNMSHPVGPGGLKWIATIQPSRVKCQAWLLENNAKLEDVGFILIKR